MGQKAEGVMLWGRLLAADTLAVIAAIALVAWLLRRSEARLAWLSFASLAWCLFNLSDLAPSEAWATVSAQIALLYPLLFATVGLAASLLQVAVARKLVAVAGGASLALGASAVAFHTTEITVIAGLASIGVSLLILGLVATRAGRQVNVFEKSLLASIYGFGILATALDVWIDMQKPSLGLLLSPYAGVMLLGFSGLVILRHVLANVEARDRLNETLSRRIETTKANLLASESARRSLVIDRAIKLERERIMREIHDGIGSSLVAALASAERQGKDSTTAIVALKGALTDLRVAIDSLEPVEGNVATLLASLRYRYEPELRKSGIAIKWMVDDVPELEWLDATSALHVLRIMQETISNSMGHSKATQISFNCKLALMSGRPGLRVEVTDNGIGFDMNTPTRGRGRNNMVQRAEALGAKLDVLSSPGDGTKTILWLPLIRKPALDAEALQIANRGSSLRKTPRASGSGSSAT
ncbi:sensor histidine kinase [Methylovirgula sp. 4M-Z18]|uniref:sensor histidine kinase n=1 Tax=Methylovirgula sp. 4M-Z18 TaxID=2293567 RepID=UPI000E367268|nr:ATP-binding protein [Methylovirgula sp. 4M-Z18]RFB76354.1 hypothetical protein DYH55_21250 [Methylovirgula sp. 4M-Z18]